MFVLTFDADPSTFRLLPIVPLPMPYQSLGMLSRHSGYAGGENGRLRLGRESFLGSVGRQRLCRIRAGTGEERGRGFLAASFSIFAFSLVLFLILLDPLTFRRRHSLRCTAANTSPAWTTGQNDMTNSA